MKKIKHYLQCPKCGKTIKLTQYKAHPEFYQGHDTICCYPAVMRVVSNEHGALPKYG